MSQQLIRSFRTYGLSGTALSQFWQLGNGGTPDPSVPNLALKVDDSASLGAAPVIAATNTYSDATGTATTTHAVNLPTGITAGDLLIVFFAINTATATTPSGWTLEASGTTADNNYVFAKVATGSEGSTLSITVSAASQRASGISYRITGWYGTLAGVEASAVVSGSTTTPDPPSYAPSWGRLDSLWIAATFANDGNYTLSSYPVEFPLGQVAVNTGAGSGNGIAVAARTGAVYAVDPGVFTTVTSRARDTFTIAVRPSALVNKSLTAAAGSYSIDGVAAGLKLGRVIAAAAGSYSITGTGAGLKHGWVTAAAAGSYTLTGQTAGLVLSRKIAAAPGSYSLTGQDAALTKSAAGAKSIVANPGSYDITGSPATLRKGWVATAAPGSYGVTGQPAALRQARKTAATAGSYSLSGSPAAFLRARAVIALAGSYGLTGSTAGLKQDRKVAASAGAYSMTGTDATLSYLPNSRKRGQGFIIC